MYKFAHMHFAFYLNCLDEVQLNSSVYTSREMVFFVAEYLQELTTSVHISLPHQE